MICLFLLLVLSAVCAVGIGLELWRGFQSGELEVGGEGPPIFLSKANHPRGYWIMSGVVGCLWYAVDLLVKSSG
jgi:hypothetical protein